MDYVPTTLNEFIWDDDISNWHFYKDKLKCKLIDAKIEPLSKYLIGIKVDFKQQTLVMRLWENCWTLSPKELLDKQSWHSTFKEASADRWYCVEWITEKECAQFIIDRINYINKTYNCSFRMKLGALKIVESYPCLAYLQAIANSGNGIAQEEAKDILTRLHILIKDKQFWEDGNLRFVEDKASFTTCLKVYGQHVLETIKLTEVRKHQVAMVDIV